MTKPKEDVLSGTKLVVIVGWVERNETHRSQFAKVMGFASLYPSCTLLGVRRRSNGVDW